VRRRLSVSSDASDIVNSVH